MRSINLSLLVGLSVLESAASGTVPSPRPSGDSSLPSAAKASQQLTLLQFWFSAVCPS